MAVVAGRSTESLDRIEMQPNQDGRIQIDALFPDMDPSSAVFPTTRENANDLVLAYHIPGCERSAVVAFGEPSGWTYGGPTDEALQTHRLFGHGLTFYHFHRVEAEGGEPFHRWVATFHDGTFEIVAKSVRVLSRSTKGAPWDALEAILGPGPNLRLDDAV